MGVIPVAPISINVPNVPFYSQFLDIDRRDWQKKGCGIASLAMVIDYYKPNAVSVNKLLALGISNGAYDYNAGWIHQGLISLAKTYGLDGTTYDLSKSSTSVAFQKFENILADGPVIASVHYKFDPKSSIPHLVVIDGIKEGTLFYNDPASKEGEKQISVADFEKGWKKKIIVIRPKVEVAMR